MNILVVTPSFNSGHFFADNFSRLISACRSMPRNSTVLWLICDNHSTDCTVTLLRRLISSYGHHNLKHNYGVDVRLIQAEDKGMYYAINNGIAYAAEHEYKYDLFVWLNSDDRIAENGFTSMSALDATPSEGPKWWICRGIDIDEKGSVIHNQPHARLSSEKLRAGDFNYTTGGWVKAESCVFNREIIETLKGFTNDLRLAGDFDLIRRASEICDPIYRDDVVSREFRRCEGQQSSNLIEYEYERRKALASHPSPPQSTSQSALQPCRRRILFYPDYRSGNSYQAMMYEELDSIGFATIEELGRFAASFCSTDAVHIHWINDIIRRPRPDALAAYRQLKEVLEQAKAAGALIVWTIHNICSHEDLNKDIEKDIYYLLIDMCNTMHVHDQVSLYEFDNFYGRIPHGKVRIVEHGPYPVEQSEIRDQTLLEFGLCRGDAYVAIPGQVRRYKDIELIGHALDYLQAAAPELPLCFLGQMHPELEEAEVEMLRGKPNSRFAARRFDDAEYSNLIRHSRFCLLTYKNISTSGSAIHALNHGVFTVAPRLGAIPAMINTSSLGVLYKSGHQPSLEAALDLALNKTEGSHRCGTKPCNPTEHRAAWSAIVNRIFD